MQLVRANRLHREDETPFTAAGDATSPGRVYPRFVERPINTALGWPLPGWLLDYGPVAFIVLEGSVAIAVHGHGGGGRVSPLLLVLALAGTAVALVQRHRAPILVLAIVLAIGIAVDYGPMVMLPTLLAVFTVAEYRDRTTVFAAAIVAFAGVIAAPVVHSATGGLGLPGVLSRLVAVGLAVAVGLYLRARADYVGGLRERAARLDRERELLAQQAAGEERVRIARELHDVVAHNVSLMVVQAQALAATGGDEPQRSSLTQLAGLGREALSEMHRMLGVLRLDDNANGAEREPAPGVRDLPRLIERAESAGISASFGVEGEPRPLPPGVDLSAYRIVQEALTNVIRHARADSVAVTLHYRPRELEVTVTDDGVGSDSNGNGGGHGLVGMRERVALFGGELSAGPTADGYRVHAALPVG